MEVGTELDIEIVKAEIEKNRKLKKEIEIKK